MSINNIQVRPTNFLIAQNIDSTQSITQTKIEKESPLGKGDVVISITAPKGEEQKALEILNGFLKLRDKESESIKKKVIVIFGDSVLREKLKSKELEQMGVTALFEEDGNSVKHKMLSPQYVLEIKNTFNNTANVYFHSLANGLLLSMREQTLDEISGNVMLYLKTGDSSRKVIPTEEEKSKAKESIQVVSDHYFKRAWEYLVDVPSERENAFVFLKNNYSGSDVLLERTLKFDRGEEPGKLLYRDKIKLLVASLNNGNKEKIQDELYYKLEHNYSYFLTYYKTRQNESDKPYTHDEIKNSELLKYHSNTHNIRKYNFEEENFILEQLGVKDFFDLLIKYRTDSENKTELKYKLFDVCLKNNETAQKMGRLIRFMEDNEIYLSEELIDLILSESKGPIKTSFEKGFRKNTEGYAVWKLYKAIDANDEDLAEEIAKDSKLSLSRVVLKNDLTPLMFASSRILFNTVRAMRPSSVDLQDKNGNTAIMHALKTNRAKESNYQFKPFVIDILLKRQADFRITNKAGEAPIDVALEQNDYEAVGLFFLYFTKEETKGKKASELLLKIIAQQHKDVSQKETLIEKKYRVIANMLLNGVSPNAVDKNGSTALMFSRDLRITQLLIEFGADVSKKNSKGETALTIAERENLTGIVEVLKAALKKQKKK